MLALKSWGIFSSAMYKFCACQCQSILQTLTLSVTDSVRLGCCEELRQAHRGVTIAGLQGHVPVTVHWRTRRQEIGGQLENRAPVEGHWRCCVCGGVFWKPKSRNLSCFTPEKLSG